MKLSKIRRIAVAVFSAAVLALSVHAVRQMPVLAAFNDVRGVIDIPGSGASVAAGAFYISGWWWDCSTDSQPGTFVFTLYNVNTQALSYYNQGYEMTAYTGLVGRTDVYNYLSGAGCSGYSGSAGSGYSLYPNATPPSGTYTVTVYAGGVVAQSYNVTIY